jgi:hypothetical protein
VQAFYDADFHREQGITEADWLQMLPGAVGPDALQLTAPGHARVAIGDGTLHLAWRVMPVRQIALIRLPRLAVHYRFEGLPDDARQVFMKRFDLYIQRGGG